jgi:hypothetical protein
MRKPVCVVSGRDTALRNACQARRGRDLPRPVGIGVRYVTLQAVRGVDHQRARSGRERQEIGFRYVTRSRRRLC